MASITIVDVARAAGVSKTTASDALRGHGRVSTATRDAVLTAAEQLGYTLNRSARSLRTATTGAIGLYLPQVLVRSEYYLAVLHGVANEAAASSYDVTLIFSRETPPAGYAPYVDGFVVCDARLGDPVVDRLLSSPLPVVSLEPIPGDRAPQGMVWTDATGSTTALLDKLVGAGSGYPAMLSTTTPSQWPRDAEQAYDTWCRSRGLTPVRAEAHYGEDAGSLAKVVDRMLGENPDVDAIVGVGDGVAARLAPGITARGYALGEDFYLASCSEQSPEPPLSVAVASNGFRAGSECTRLLFELIRGEAAAGIRREMPVEIVTTASAAKV